VFNIPHVVLESRGTGLMAVKLTEEPYLGVIFQYGQVNFDEAEEQLKISFDYDILDYNDNVISDTAAFEQYIGDLLQDFIREGISRHSISYTGGIDAD